MTGGHGGERKEERRGNETGKRERDDRRAAPPDELRLGADPESLVERPRGQLAAEQEQDCHDWRGRVHSASRGDDSGDVGRAGEPEREAECDASAGEGDKEQQRSNRSARCERRRNRVVAGEGNREGAAVRRDREGSRRQAGRARCLNAFTSSSGAASGASSRHRTTGTPTCS